MRTSHGIIFAKSILCKGNSQCKGLEADGDCGSEELQRIWCGTKQSEQEQLFHAGPLQPSRSLAFVLNETGFFNRGRLLPGGRKPQRGEEIGAVVQVSWTRWQLWRWRRSGAGPGRSLNKGAVGEIGVAVGQAYASHPLSCCRC